MFDKPLWLLEIHVHVHPPVCCLYMSTHQYVVCACPHTSMLFVHVHPPVCCLYMSTHQYVVCTFMYLNWTNFVKFDHKSSNMRTLTVLKQHVPWISLVMFTIIVLYRNNNVCVIYMYSLFREKFAKHVLCQ